MFHGMAFFLSIICCSESRERKNFHSYVCLCVFVVFHNCSTCLLFFLATIRFYLRSFFCSSWEKIAIKNILENILFSLPCFFSPYHKNLPRRAKIPHVRWDMTISFNGKSFLYFQYLFLCILNENYFDFSPFYVCLNAYRICMPRRR